jgi:DNA-binding LytR/AlgR family response regulator
VKDGKKAMFLEVGKIFYLEAQGNYTKVISPLGQILMRRPIRYFEERFDPKLFLRANRSLMLNLELVARWEAIQGGRFKAILEGGSSFEISRRQSRSLQERMKL